MQGNRRLGKFYIKNRDLHDERIPWHDIFKELAFIPDLFLQTKENSQHMHPSRSKYELKIFYVEDDGWTVYSTFNIERVK